MKKIYYLLAFIAVAAGFTACDPLNKTYKDLDAIPSAATATAKGQSITLTLAAADYGLLPSTNYAKTSLSFKIKDDAAASIPTILASKYGNYPNGSSAAVTYAITPTTIKVADTVYTHVAYTLTTADYTLVTTFGDLSAAQALTWLGKYYTTPVPNQLAVLNFLYFENSVAYPGTVQSFLYLNGAWQKIYMVSPAQYTSVGKGGNNNDFAAADVANLPAYFNTFLKTDPSVSVAAKFGDVKYVSYKYYGGSTANTFQRVQPMTFDGTNWVTSPITATITFLKTNGVWLADNSVYYTMVQADYTTISKTTIGSDAARANIASFPDFNTSASTDATYWSDADITSGILVVLSTKYGATAVKDQKFNITYTVYSFGATSNKVKVFVYDGSKFVFQP